MGSIMLDVAGCELTAEERDILDHPLVGGVILFTRNYFDKEQLQALVKDLRKAARNPLLIGVDHEGGRVQRFREGFTRLPAMGDIYAQSDNQQQAAKLAEQTGWLMAAEVLAMDIDISFAPVLDINGISEVIGDRSFHQQPEVIIELAGAFVKGMHSAGMKSTGKHFPGHGNVKEDSHIAIPIDRRSAKEIMNTDMAVFDALHQRQLLDAVMPAHVIYPEVDAMPAGFSSRWIKQILRTQLAFDGVVFSDDLSMQGAAQLGDFVTRAITALEAGCDMVLVCNDPMAAVQVLDGLPNDFPTSARLASMRNTSSPSFTELQSNPHYQTAKKSLEEFYAK